jgi:hypothetical protein
VILTLNWYVSLEALKPTVDLWAWRGWVSERLLDARQRLLGSGLRVLMQVWQQPVVPERSVPMGMGDMALEGGCWRIVEVCSSVGRLVHDNRACVVAQIGSRSHGVGRLGWQGRLVELCHVGVLREVISLSGHLAHGAGEPEVGRGHLSHGRVVSLRAVAVRWCSVGPLREAVCHGAHVERCCSLLMRHHELRHEGMLRVGGLLVLLPPRSRQVGRILGGDMAWTVWYRC